MTPISGLSSIALRSLQQGLAAYDKAAADLVRSVTPQDSQRADGATGLSFDTAVVQMSEAEAQVKFGVTLARKAQDMTGTLLDILA